MTALILSYGVPCLVALIAGAVAGAFTAVKLRPDAPVTEPVEAVSESDQFIDAEIDLAAVRWAETHNQPPEAAGLMAERLRTLRTIGKRKGWM
jgi:hypothetical protein